jgi:hypothetical protein
VEVTHGEDPDAIVALAEHYYGARRFGDIDELLMRYQDHLFTGKGLAYQRNDWASIYRFHVALGTMYAAVGKTGNESDPRSAIFQLDHARRAAERNNATPNTVEIHVDPVIVERLAASYEKASRPKDAENLRIEAADRYASRGRRVAAEQTLAPLVKERQKLDPEKLRRVDEIEKKAAVPKDVYVVKPPS